MKDRIHYWDNLKGFLILLVVLGHLLEKLPDGRTSALYKMIYLFHMPLFVFCSGFLAKYDPGKILKKLLIPYAFLQVVSCIGNGQPIQLLTPVWILWYLPALAIWQVAIPFLDLYPHRFRPLMLLAAVIAACAAGFDNEVGYHLTLSRILVFFPYFIAGYYARQHQRQLPESRMPQRVLSAKVSLALRVLSITIIAAFAGRFLAEAAHILPEWLYGAASYHAVHSSILFRAMHYLLAVVTGLSVMLWIPRRANPLGRLGRCTLLIYLSHIVLMPIAENLPRFVPAVPLQYLLCVLIAAVFCTIISLLAEHIPAKYRS